MDIFSILKSFIGTFLTTLIFIGIYFVIKNLLDRQKKAKPDDSSVLRTIILFSIGLTAAIAIILSFPVSESLRSQITNLIGIILAAVLSLSSATFIGNGFAGIMLRTINNFKPGDFIRVGDYFGRISERGLFHTEIQTDNRDLVTLPNLYLATNPVQVTRSSGSFISAVVSLGYDVSRIKIKMALLDAANRAGLEDAFVLVEELGDYSVVYRVRGLLTDLKTYIGARSNLNSMVLDALHDANIEIVSPSFMNQRQLGNAVFIPQKAKKSEEKAVEAQAGKPDAVVFDKADQAETNESRRQKVAELDSYIKEQQILIKNSKTDQEKAICQQKIEKYVDLRDKIVERIKKDNTFNS